jgi:hypothetical protein
MYWKLLSKTGVILLLGLCAFERGVMPGPSEQAPQSPRPEPRFAFWYEPWKGSDTFNKVAKAGYVVGVSPGDVSSVHQLGSRALRYVTFYQAQFGSAFLKDQADLANVGFLSDNAFLPSAFGRTNNYVLCDNSEVMHKRALAFVDETLQKEQFDGLFVDNTYLSPAALRYCSSKSHFHTQPGMRGDDSWLELLSEVRKEVKTLSPSALIITNPGNPNTANRLGTGKYSLWNLSDYILWESYGYTSYRDKRHDHWQEAIASSFALPEAERRKILALSYPLSGSEALYSFAVARIFGFEWTANLGERDTTTEKDGGHFGAFLSDIPFQLGPSKGPIEGSRNSAFIARAFEKGRAIANISAFPTEVEVPGISRVYVGDRVSEYVRSTKITLSPGGAVVCVFK